MFQAVEQECKWKDPADLKRFVGWALTSGQQYGPKLLFVPVPRVVQKAAQKTLKRVHS